MQVLAFKWKPFTPKRNRKKRCFVTAPFLASDYCRALFRCLNCAQWFDYRALGTIVGSGKDPPNIWLTVAKNTFVGWALNFRVRMLLKAQYAYMSGEVCYFSYQLFLYQELRREGQVLSLFNCYPYFWQSRSRKVKKTRHRITCIEHYFLLKSVLRFSKD